MPARRREAIGRNRRSPRPRGTTRYLVVGCVVLLFGAVYAYHYFTRPERVFGVNQLDCPAHQIEWAPEGELTAISGCGQTILAVCDERRCDFPPR